MIDFLVYAIDNMVGIKLTEEDDKIVYIMLKLLYKSASKKIKIFGRTATQLSDRLYPHMGRFSLKTAIQTVYISKSLLNVHLDYIKDVLETILSPPPPSGSYDTTSRARLKELRKLTSLLVATNYRSTNAKRYWAWLTEELQKKERIEEIWTYPQVFIYLMSYFVIAGYYPNALLKLALQPEMIDAALRASYSAGSLLSIIFFKCFHANVLILD